jgi:hypothetical protein
MLSAPQSWSLDRTLHFPTKPSGHDEGLAALNQKDHGGNMRDEGLRLLQELSCINRDRVAAFGTNGLFIYPWN